MITTGEFNIFHICTGSFQCFIRFARTFHRNYIVRISVKDTKFHILGNR